MFISYATVVFVFVWYFNFIQTNRVIILIFFFVNSSVSFKIFNINHEQVSSLFEEECQR